MSLTYKTSLLKNNIISYKNGNYTVILYPDGTKFRILDDGEEKFIADFPENIDLKISNKCSLGCKYCHEDSNKNGKTIQLTKEGKFELDHLVFLNGLNPGTELAIGGGALSEFEELEYFLWKVSIQKVIANITVNARELLKNKFFNFILNNIYFEDRNLSKLQIFFKNHKDELELDHKNFLNNTLFYGLGISYVNDPECKKRMLYLKMLFPNSVVIHTIYGVTTKEDYQWLAENGFKVLVLGYKNFRRGEAYLIQNKEEIEKNMKDFKENINFYYENCKVLSFDCLACEQLELKKYVSPEIWNSSYMGEDGQFTMYVDLVENTFSTSSSTPEREHMKDYKFSAPLMFKKIQNKSLKNK